MVVERALKFVCAGVPLVGILHSVDKADVCVLVVVGGPQYRIGSHRQFVLLSRYLAEHGISSFRFDYRGIGDSAGVARDFRQIDEDIRSAMDLISGECPSVRTIYIWGLCDAASAALLYAHRDVRVAGLVLCNPWVRTDRTLAQAVVQRYSLGQLTSGDFWRRLATGRVSPVKSLRGAWATVRAALAREAPVVAESSSARPGDFVEAMLAGLQRFTGPVLVVLSGDDLTAAEFEGLLEANREWREAFAGRNATFRKLPESTHTFSSRAWRNEVARLTHEWILS